MKSPIYLDNAAATPLDKQVLAAMQSFFTDRFYNPSAVYLHGKGIAQELAGARAAVGKILGVKSSEVYFMAGGTEANNQAIYGLMERYNGANVVVSAIEHDSVLKPAARYERRVCTVNSDGTLNLNSLRASIDDQTVLISVMYANNEIGTIQSLRDVAEIIEAIRRDRRSRLGKEALPIYFHTDACQAANYLDLQVARLGVDMMTLNGGKIYGPKQSAVLYLRAGIELAPLIHGGGQEFGLRSGTENVPACIGFAVALERAQEMRDSESYRVAGLRDLMIAELTKAIPLAIVNGSIKHRLANNVHITIPESDNERMMMELDERGIMCATGSACSASSDEPSHVLKAIGLDDASARASLRFTLGRQTDESMIRATVKSLAEIAKR